MFGVVEGREEGTFSNLKKKEEMLCFLSDCFGWSSLYVVFFCLTLAWLATRSSWVSLLSPSEFIIS